MTRPRFSIVLPTRNRPDTLRSALTTCIAQNYDDYEIVVCDNSDDGETEQVVRDAASPRIRYLPPTEPLAMSANWERGVNEARGEYVTVLGDDDGLMPYALAELDALITTHRAQAVVWQRGIYTWPTIGVPGEADLLRIPLARTVIEMHGREQVRKAVRFEAGTDTLPMIYTAAVHRDLIERHRQLAGRMFLNVYPDVYSAFGLGYLADRYIWTSVPMNIAGLSRASNGVATLMHTSNNAVATDFERLNAAFGYVRHSKVPDKMILGPVHVVDCFLHAKDALFPDDDSLVLDRKAFTLQCLAAIFDVEPSQRQRARLTVRESLADDQSLLDWFDAEAPDFPPGQVFSFQPPQLGFDGSMLNLRTTPYGVKDIAGAVTLATQLLGFASGKVAYNIASWEQMHAAIANASKTVEAVQCAETQVRAEALEQLAQVDTLREQLVHLENERSSAVATAARLQQLLGEAQHNASLRYVPKRLIAKLTGWAAKGKSP
ncbi:MAG: glycosyltransferase family 2 protein [Hyphomicrobiales bacterium]|nr:MAG: glycosyltransferase family 2 protein [Hyphomicrobiales bacterium]